MTAQLPPPADFYSADNFTCEPSLGWLLRQIKQSMVLQADKMLGQHDLTHAQWAPMLRLRFNGPMSSAALARELAMDGGAMTRLLDRLEDHETPVSAREVVVTLKGKGARRIDLNVAPVADTFG